VVIHRGPIPEEDRTPAKDLWRGLKLAPFMFLLGLAFAFVPGLLHGFEARQYPVVTPVAIVGPIQEVNGGIMFSGEATKLRNCAWRETVWYFGDRNGANVVLTNSPHLDPPKINGVGRLHWDKIFLPNMTADKLPQTFADAYHSCYSFSNWLTRSAFYDGEAG